MIRNHQFFTISLIKARSDQSTQKKNEFSICLKTIRTHNKQQKYTNNKENLLVTVS